MTKAKYMELYNYTLSLRDKGLTEKETKELVIIRGEEINAGYPNKIISVFEKAWNAERRYRYFDLTDLGNAERFVAEHGENLLYCPDRWLHWEGNRWKADSRKNVIVQRKAQQTVKRMKREAERIVDQELRDRMIGHANYSASDHKIRAMINQAKSLPSILINEDELDMNPWFLNCENGTLNLKTGELGRYERKDHITKMIPIEYDPDAKYRRWEDFLYQVMGKNHDLVDFLWRAVGYSLTGDVREECLFMLYGTGANGKTTFLETLKDLLGDYAKTSDFNTFIDKRYDSIRNDIARLKGARLVVSAESKRGRKFDESLIKQVTGRDTLVARFLYQEHFEFIPEFKIFLAFNNKPRIEGTDYGIWRRIRLVPFAVTIPKDKQDQKLRSKLRMELPGILAWAVKGCLEWQKEGLKVPDEVLEATKQFEEEMDMLGRFIYEHCQRVTGTKESTSNLYNEYKQYCKYHEIFPESKVEFGRQLSKRGFERKRSNKGTVWRNLTLKSETQKKNIKKSKMRKLIDSGKLREELIKRVQESYERRFDS